MCENEIHKFRYSLVSLWVSLVLLNVDVSLILRCILSTEGFCKVPTLLTGQPAWFISKEKQEHSREVLKTKLIL